MLQQLLSLVPDWSWWSLGIGGIGAVGLAVLAPSLALSVLLAVINFVISATQTVWERVFWPGLKDILDSWVTIVTVATAAFVLWSVLKTDFALREASLNQKLQQCTQEMRGLKGTASRLERGLKVSPSFLPNIFKPLEELFK